MIRLSVLTFFLVGLVGQQVFALDNGNMEAKQSSPDQTPTIPHQMWFIKEEDMARNKGATSHPDENVLNTISEYRRLWEKPLAPVHFLNYESCRPLIEETEPRLMMDFDNENNRAKADMCRIAVLYLHGGYFFDSNIRVVEPYVPLDDVSFVSARSPNGYFFNAFIASSPKHPLLERALKQTVAYFRLYRIPKEPTTLLGPKALEAAHIASTSFVEENIHLLTETELGETEYPSLERQKGWGSCLWAVHDPGVERVYFFSRFPGAKDCFPLAEGGIPRQITWTYDRHQSRTYGQNSVGMVKGYRRAWENRYAPVRAMDGNECAMEVNKVNPELVRHFKREKSMQMRDILCKVSHLYRHGGYVMDANLRFVTAYEPTGNVSFAAALSCDGGCFLSSFLASTPRHPILRGALDEFLAFYRNGTRTSSSSSLEPRSILASAYYSLPEAARGDVHLLHEVNLKPDDHPHVKREGVSPVCNNAIAGDDDVYFFSRPIHGSKDCGELVPDLTCYGNCLKPEKLVL